MRTPETNDEWTTFVRQLLKAHMTLMSVSYADLQAALNRIGIEESEVNIRNRINRGRFSAVFLLQCLRAMRVDNLVLPTDQSGEQPADA